MKALYFVSLVSLLALVIALTTGFFLENPSITINADEVDQQELVTDSCRAKEIGWGKISLSAINVVVLTSETVEESIKQNAREAICTMEETGIPASVLLIIQLSCFPSASIEQVARIMSSIEMPENMTYQDINNESMQNIIEQYEMYRLDKMEVNCQEKILTTY